MSAIRTIRRFLAGRRAARRPDWGHHAVIFMRAKMLVTAFYVFSVYILAGYLHSAQKLSATDPAGFAPVWSASWAHLTGLDAAAAILSALYIGASVYCLLAPGRLTARALMSLAILQAISFDNSWGAINHGEHAWFWVSVCLLFLPNGGAANARSYRMQYISAVGGGIALHLFFYTMSGVYKWAHALPLAVTGQFGGLSYDAMAVTLAGRHIVTDSAPLLSDLIIQNPILGWPMYLIVYYVELFAILVFFRPALHQTWGVILLLFHAMIMLTMQFGSPNLIALNALLLVLSPFRRKTSLAEAAKDLPVLGVIFEGLSASGRTIRPKGPE